MNPEFVDFNESVRESRESLQALGRAVLRGVQYVQETNEILTYGRDTVSSVTILPTEVTPSDPTNL